MLTKLIAGIEVTENLFIGEGLLKPSANRFENFRRSVGIKDPSLLPDVKIKLIQDTANGLRGPNPLKYSNIFGFYVQMPTYRIIYDAVKKLGGTVNDYEIKKTSLKSEDTKTRFQQLTMYFNNILKTEILLPEQKKQVQVALQCIQLGKLDAAMDTYFDMKWIDIRMRVALVHIIYHAQDINIMSVHIEKNDKTGKDHVLGMRPSDKKVCEFVYNAETPALSFWSVAGRP